MRTFRAIAFLLFAVVCLMGASAPKAHTASLLSSTAVYKQAGEGATWGELEEGTQVELLEISGDWSQIRYMLREGYVPSNCLAAAADGGRAAKQITVLGRTLYIYREVALTSHARANPITLYPKDEVVLLGISGDSAQVMSKSGSGTVKQDALSVDRELRYILGYPGDSNKRVEARLEALGHFDAIPNDVFDLDTAEAVLRLRVQGGLSEECLLDEDFHALLDAPDAPASMMRICQLRPGDSGDMVKRMQNRLIAKGYLEATVLGYYDSLTAQAVMLYQSMEGFSQTGIADPATLTRLFSGDARTLPRNLMPATRETAQYLPGGVSNPDWWTSDIQTIYDRGVVAQITDVETGLTWNEVRRGGTSHADVQPLTVQDTEAFKAACGGSWSWARRAIWVTVDGMRYAASMNCMPHGNGAVSDNGFPGHHCVHFLNSRTHGGNNLDEAHQRCVAIAASTDFVTAQSVDWNALYGGTADAHDANE